MSCKFDVDILEDTCMKYDDIFSHLLALHNGRIHTFLSCLANYLRRETDFFKQYAYYEWEKVLFDIFAKEYESYKELCKREKVNEVEQTEIGLNEAVGQQFNHKEIREEEIQELLKCQDNTVSNTQQELKDENIVQKSELLSNNGRGCDFDNWKWTQTRTEIAIHIDYKTLDYNLESSDIVVEFDKHSLKVGLKGQLPTITGNLHEEVNSNECHWILVDTQVLVITLSKSRKNYLWNRLFNTDSPIKIYDPTDLDEKTLQKIARVDLKISPDHNTEDLEKFRDELVKSVNEQLNIVKELLNEDEI